MIYCMNKTAAQILTEHLHSPTISDKQFEDILNAMEAYKAQSSGMKWVKASERLPNEVHVGEEIVYELLNHVYCAHAWHNTPDEISLFKNAVLRWLDEGD